MKYNKVNKYFLYFVALKQNYWENILTELDTILSNKYIKDHPIVKIILKNEIYINLIPELLDKQLKIIETSKFRAFFSQKQIMKELNKKRAQYEAECTQ